MNLKRKDLKAELGRAISSTYFHPSTGTSQSVLPLCSCLIADTLSSVRIATPSHTTGQQTTENLLAAVPKVVELIQDGWENVLSIGVKTGGSLLLPIWAAKLEGRFKGVLEPVHEPTTGVAHGTPETAKRSQGDKTEKLAGKEQKAKKTAAVESVVDAGKDVPAIRKKKVLSEKKGFKNSTDGKKKSSTLGSGGAGTRAKESILGRP